MNSSTEYNLLNQYTRYKEIYTYTCININFVMKWGVCTSKFLLYNVNVIYEWSLCSKKLNSPEIITKWNRNAQLDRACHQWTTSILRRIKRLIYYVWMIVSTWKNSKHFFNSFMLSKLIYMQWPINIDVYDSIKFIFLWPKNNKQFNV